MLDAASIRSYDFFEFVGLKIAGFALQHPEEFISATDVHSLLRQVEKRHPGLIGEGFGREFVSVPKLAEILQELIRQGLSVRDFRAVAEGVASFCSASGVTLDNENTVDAAAVVDHIRAARRRTGSWNSSPVRAAARMGEVARAARRATEGACAA